MAVKHITMVSSGTRGDVQPYVALGLGLQRAGFRVRLACAENFAEFVTGFGLEFCPGAEDVEARLRDPQTQAMMRRHSNPLQVFRLLMQGLSEGVERQVQQLWSACQGTDAIIGHFIDTWQVRPIAEYLGLPFIDSGVVPDTPTGAFPSAFLPFQRSLGAGYNRVTARLLFRLTWALLNPIIEKNQRKLFNSPARRSGWQRGLDPSAPVLYGYSPAFLPKPPDWGAHIHVTGYWFLDDPSEPDPELHRFIEAGEAPVYVGFGSMPSADPRQMAVTVCEALKRSGQRGVLLSGWGGLDSAGLPEGIYAASSLPHSWLFPRCKAVIHHGGAGTTGAGIRAGVPAIVVPFAGDQPFWAQRVYEKGIGPRPIPRHRLTAERLAQAIEQSLGDAEMRRRAQSLGEAVRREDGVGRAVEVIACHFS